MLDIVCNYLYDTINSDLFAPPGTDSGDVSNAKWPMGLSHNRGGLKNSGWARQQNVAVLSEATAMAGVNMRLEPHAYRELHWHKASEWSLIMNGSVRVQAINENGETFVDDLNEGDVWFFPPGIPHSIQAFENGTEFLLVFDDGEFSEENTFLISEVMQRNPLAVMAKDLQTSINALNSIPDDQLWIFPGTAQSKDIETQNVTGAAGVISGNGSYTYHFSQQQPYEVDGGSVKIIDPETFPIASSFSAALVTIKPGAMRELHWHLDSDEWSFFVSGTAARVTVFQAPESSRTFDFTAGDVAYIPVPESHYIENVGDDDIVVLEVLQSTKFTDISLSQWIALTPNQIIKDHLGISDEVINAQPKEKTLLKPGSTNSTETNFTVSG
ncbi:putative oxalate decarboxylase oxdd [Phaeomoniella chlamydospora]|uniref:Putative oxalate decarboxylase oxdd n=1 Tax=Phaeomoniella chlamydospora TaxID=158046 RepID=A0A0G2EZ04_PHACM|nr:putative oxalate decarboxylase oxdd [Phaeomoniella chlamydospora]